MPVTYSIDRNARILRTRCVGDVTFAEVENHFRELEQDPALGDDFDILLDLSELTAMPTSGQLQAVSLEIERIQPKAPFRACAVVATSDLLFGMGRMFEAYVEGRFTTSRVFRQAAEAEAWLAAMA
jgi:hypothetical protein